MRCLYLVNLTKWRILGWSVNSRVGRPARVVGLPHIRVWGLANGGNPRRPVSNVSVTICHGLAGMCGIIGCGEEKVGLRDCTCNPVTRRFKAV